MNTLETFRQAAEARKRKKEQKKHSESPETNNMNVQQAFLKATESNPKSSISRVIKRITKIRAEERVKQREIDQFVQLKKQLKDMGHSWFSIRVGIPMDRRFDLSTARIYDQRIKQWTQTLTALKNRPSEERIELLSAIASGMQITEYGLHHGTHPVYAKSFPSIFSDPLGDLPDELAEVRFSPPSIIFIEAFINMSGYSGQQRKEFRDEFMVKKSGLKGKVELPQLFPAISRWMDHAK